MKTFVEVLFHVFMFFLSFSQIEALQEVLEKLKSKQLPPPSEKKKLGLLPSVRKQTSLLLNLEVTKSF